MIITTAFGPEDFTFILTSWCGFYLAVFFPLWYHCYLMKELQPLIRRVTFIHFFFYETSFQNDSWAWNFHFFGGSFTAERHLSSTASQNLNTESIRAAAHVIQTSGSLKNPRRFEKTLFHFWAEGKRSTISVSLTTRMRITVCLFFLKSRGVHQGNFPNQFRHILDYVWQAVWWKRNTTLESQKTRNLDRHKIIYPGSPKKIKY